MIQDAHPMRSGVPDCYEALYRIDVLVLATTWNVNLERFPSGFTGNGAVPPQARTGAGQGSLRFPAGMRVRQAVASYSPPTNAVANQRKVTVNTISESAGTCNFTLTNDAGAATDPVDPTSATSFDSTIWVRLTLETV